MPKRYAMGGRAPSAPPGELPPSPTPQSLRERLGALKNLPPFLKLVWKTSPALTAALVALRIVRALLPVVPLYVGKLIIDEAVRPRGVSFVTQPLGEWIASGQLDHIGALLALEFGLAVASDVLGRYVSLLD